MSQIIRNKRNHGVVIFENSIKSLTGFIIPFAVTLIPSLASGRKNLLMSLMLIIPFIGLGIIYYILNWYFKTYSIENGLIIFRYGIFIKKERRIPVSSIATIHELQTFSQRLFGIWTLKLDTAASLLKGDEIRLVVSRNNLEAIKNIMKEFQSGSESEERKESPLLVYSSKISDLVKLGLTSNALFTGLALIISLFQLFSEFFESKAENLLIIVQDLIHSPDRNITPKLFLVLFLAVILYSVFSLFTAAVISVVKYHDFRVLNENGTILIRYGLFKKNNFSIQEDKIHVLYYKQSFLRQLLGLASVSIESTGYGNEKGEEALIIPLARLSRIHGLLNKIFTHYKHPEKYENAPKRSFLRFAADALIYPLTLIIPICVFYPYGYLSLLLIPFFLASGILQYKNTKISWDSKRLFLCYGGFTRSFAEIKRGGVQAVIKKVSPFQRTADLFTLNISIHGAVFGKSLSVKHLDAGLFQEISDLL